METFYLTKKIKTERKNSDFYVYVNMYVCIYLFILFFHFQKIHMPFFKSVCDYVYLYLNPTTWHNHLTT